MSIEIRGVTKRYGGFTAVDGLTFSAAPGQILGFLGPNGAGKTSTIRMVLGLMAPSGGRIEVLGADDARKVRDRIGFLPEERGLYAKMGVREQLVFFARLHGLSARAAAQATDDLIDQLGIAERAGDRVEALSLGNQQRVQVAASLMHHPTALVLDEPFSGLDPLAVDSMTKLLAERAATGVPILFSSHQLDLIDTLCDNLVVLAGGKIVASGSAAELRARASAS